jgi:hypothetical protein
MAQPPVVAHPVDAGPAGAKSLGDFIHGQQFLGRLRLALEVGVGQDEHSGCLGVAGESRIAAIEFFNHNEPQNPLKSFRIENGR